MKKITDHLYWDNGKGGCMYVTLPGVSCNQDIGSHPGHEWVGDDKGHNFGLDVVGLAYAQRYNLLQGQCKICGVIGSKHPHEWVGVYQISVGPASVPCSVCGVTYSKHTYKPPIIEAPGTNREGESSARAKKELGKKGSPVTTKTGPSMSKDRKARLAKLKDDPNFQAQLSHDRQAHHERTASGPEKQFKNMAGESADLDSMTEKQLSKHFEKSPPLSWDQLSPEMQAQVQKKAGRFAAAQTGGERWDADGNYLGEMFSGGNLRMEDGRSIHIDSEPFADFSKMSQKELNLFNDTARHIKGTAIPSNQVGNRLIDASALPAEMIPEGYSRTDYIPSNVFKPGTAIPANALPASMTASALGKSVLIDSSALPAELIPKGYEKGDYIPAEAFPGNFAIPSNTLPFMALPAEALPAEALPAEALPAEALPAEALPAEALPAEALPAEALPAEALPAEALPAEALPAEALPAEALPAEALPAEALPAEALPAEALKATAIPSNTRTVFSALSASMLNKSLKIDSSKLPKTIKMPKGYKRGDLIPAKAFPGDLAIPSNALPAEVFQSFALPAEVKSGGRKRK